MCVSVSCCWLPGCLVCLFDHFIKSFLSIVSPWGGSWLHSDSFSLRPCPLFRPFLLVSIHPSTHLVRVRRDGPSGAVWSEGWSDSWSPVRQGETNYPSNEDHSSSLHLSSLPSSTPPSEIQRTWMATPGGKKTQPPKKLNFYSLHCSHSVITHAATAISALFY